MQGQPGLCSKTQSQKDKKIKKKFPSLDPGLNQSLLFNMTHRDWCANQSSTAVDWARCLSHRKEKNIFAYMI